MTSRWLFLAVLLSLTCPPAWAQDPAGSEFQVNSYTRSSQYHAAVASDASGNFVVVWTSYRQDGSGGGIFGQRFNAAGVAQGSEFRVNTYTTSGQYFPAVASDANGNFVVVWEGRYQDGSAYGVFGQRFNASGLQLGSEFQVNTYTTDTQRSSAVASDANGNFVVVWESRYQDDSVSGIFGQRFTAAGVPQGGEFQVNSYTTSFQAGPRVASAASGNFVVVWTSDGQDGSGGGIFGQRFNASGLQLGSEFQVNTYTTNSQLFPAVSSDATGNFVVVWESRYQDGSGGGIFGQRFNASGLQLGSEFQVNTYTVNSQLVPAVSSDATGNFVVVWESLYQDGSVSGIFGQRFTAAGVPQGGEFQVNSYTTSGQYRPAVATAPNGNFVVAWNSRYQDGSYFGVFGQRFGDLIFRNGFE